MNTVEDTNDYSPSAGEIYQTLLRSLRRRKGFGIVFIQCSPAQANRLIPQLQTDLLQKRVSILNLSVPIDNLYNLVAEQLNRTETDILFIRGLEKSLESDIQPGYGGEGDYYNLSTVPRVLSHLNQQRENFRDHFNRVCFVFVLPLFAIKYFIRRAPDFFDWSSGVFEFSANAELEQYLESKLGIENSLQTKIERERELARMVCRIDWTNSSECSAAWDAVEELQAESSHQRQPVHDLDKWLADKKNRTYSSDEGQLLLEGDHFLESRSFDEALNRYNTALEFEPNCYEAWNGRGVALVELERYQEAIDSLDHAINLKSDYYEAWYNRGVSLFNLNLYQEAIDSYGRALELKSDYPEAWNNRGIALVELGHYQEAIDSFDHAINLKSDYYEAWNNRGIALVELGHYQEAIDSYEKAIKIKFDKYEAWKNRGIALVKLRRYEEAIDSYKKASEFEPNQYEIWYNRGIALRSLGRYEEAIASYDQAIKLKPEFLEAWYNRGIALRNLGRYEEAIASYNHAIEIASNESNLHYGKACCYGLQGNVEEAVDALQQAININPECQETAKTDSDFDRIRNDDRFQALVDE